MILYLLWLTLENPVSWKTRQPPFCPLLESMLIWLIPIVLELQATLHLLYSIDVSASMSHCTDISLSDRSAPGRSGLQAQLKQDLLSSAYGDVCFIVARNGMCMLTRAVFLLMWAMLFPWLCGPDTENAPGLQCVSCLHLHVSPSSALHFLSFCSPW